MVGTLIPAMTGIMTVAPSPPSTFVVVGGIAADWLVGRGGGWFDVSVRHINAARTGL